MVAPVDLTESLLTATIYLEDETTREKDIVWKNLAAGNAYRFSIDLNGTSTETEGTIPNNQIWYTSSDEKVVTPNNSEGFGAKIISNTYNNGMGVIRFDKDLIAIGERAFYHSTTLTSVTIPNGVTTLEESAFSDCYSLTDVSLPSGLTTICDYAFKLCSSLANITIPSSVTSIGKFAFSSCTGLASFIIPDNVAEIGAYAFNGCNSLSDIIIPASVQSIGNCAFSECPYLSIEVDANNHIYDSRDNCNAIIETSSNTLIQGCNKTIIPNSVAKIGGQAFAYCDIENITIPQGVSSIGGGAFFDCYSLKSITIPNSVDTIKGSAFYGCNSLGSIIIPQGVTTIESSTFSNCRWLSSILIPSTVTKIGEWAFSSCSALTNVTIPDSVVEIERGAFNIRSYFSSQVHIHSINPPKIYSSDTFDQNAKIYIPAGSIEVYKSADYWKNLNLIEEESPIQAVDLGLSVKWANCNVDARSPEEAGGYYSWGETEEKSNYDHSTYKWSNGDVANWLMTKYCTNSENGTIDNKTVLDLEDDVANVKLGDGWRTPTIEEFQELFNNCSWEWTSMNGVNGYKISGNGNSIFLPAAGCRYYDEVDVRSFSELGAYWSASLHDENSSTAWGFSFDETDVYEKDIVSRYPGVTIRPVKM